MGISYTDNGERAAVLKGVRRLVIKVGSRLLISGKDAATGQRIEEIIARIAELRAKGLEVLLVTSGAIGTGMTVLGTRCRPRAIPELQAHAAVGQCQLMYLYETACSRRGFHCAQLLLTAADVHDRERHLNVSNCLNDLLARGVLPVINENDSVSVEEIKFGDNDTLAALVASMARADLTILLTSIDGMHEPAAAGFGARLSVVSGVSAKIKSMAGGTDGNELSVGGMITKVRAAELVTRSGEPLWIADGRDFAILQTIIEGTDVGTLFVPVKNARMSASKRYLAFFSRPGGELVVDAGAERAVCEGGKSLLPSGIRAVRGAFRKGATLRVLGPAGNEIAKGVTNYDAADVERIMGRRSAELAGLIGGDAYQEVIHRDHLVLTR